MNSTVKSRPSHYEVLDVRRDASEAEIKRAFAAKMSLFGAHRIAEASQISTAFETLRDLTKRRAYDRSIGLGLAPQPGDFSFAVAPPNWTPFIATKPSVRSVAAAEVLPERHLPVEAKADGAPDPRLAAVAASLRELARPTSEAVSQPSPQPEFQPQSEAVGPPPEARRPAPRSDEEVHALTEHIRSVGRQEKHELASTSFRFPNWKQPTLALGGLILGAGLFGTLAGLSVKDNATAADAEPALTVPLPTPGSGADVALPPEPAVGTGDAQASRRIAAMDSVPDDRRVAVAAPRVTASSEAVEAPPPPPVTGEATADALAPTSEDSAQPVAASLPLPNGVIARTIERIGYSCGTVTSAAAVEGSSGVYKVTCSSGQTYQATPVRGRYHFRRAGGS